MEKMFFVSRGFEKSWCTDFVGSKGIASFGKAGWSVGPNSCLGSSLGLAFLSVNKKYDKK